MNKTPKKAQADKRRICEKSSWLERFRLIYLKAVHAFMMTDQESR